MHPLKKYRLLSRVFCHTPEPLSQSWTVWSLKSDSRPLRDRLHVLNFFATPDLVHSSHDNACVCPVTNRTSHTITGPPSRIQPLRKNVPADTQHVTSHHFSLAAGTSSPTRQLTSTSKKHNVRVYHFRLITKTRNYLQLHTKHLSANYDGGLHYSS